MINTYGVGSLGVKTNTRGLALLGIDLVPVLDATLAGASVVVGLGWVQGEYELTAPASRCVLVAVPTLQMLVSIPSANTIV